MPLFLHFHIDTKWRRSLRASHRRRRDACSISNPATAARIAIEIPAPRRGWLSPGRIKLYSEYPFGLFHVWSWLNPDFSALVYPRLDENAPPLPQDSTQAHAQPVRGRGDELAMLREYRPSDPVRSIAWKASARHDALLVKEFEQFRGREILLSFASLRGLDYEAASHGWRAGCAWRKPRRFATRSICRSDVSNRGSAPNIAMPACANWR